MPIRLGRKMREMLLTAVDLHASGLLLDLEAKAFLHKHRKAFRELSITYSKAFTGERSLARHSPQLPQRATTQTLQPERCSNLTTGPERVPLKPWTPAQVDAYRKQRIGDSAKIVIRARLL